MGQQVVLSGMIQCSMAVVPTPIPLVVTPEKRVLAGNLPAANIMDHVPIKNIPTFGLCRAPLNPTVIAATAAPVPGVPKPGACIPATPAPWIVGAPTVLIGNFPALNNSSKCMCTWGGVISIVFAGQVTVQIP
ncbi:MAG: DUF4280 domain-containing protein [Pseudanabaena sp.]|nr:MAG: DUF4280 domain-containing protein [Pseudanabaena sp.]